MTTRVLRFVSLPRRGRRGAAALPSLTEADELELRVCRGVGHEPTPRRPELAALVGELLEHLRRGERVAVVAEEREPSPAEATAA